MGTSRWWAPLGGGHAWSWLEKGARQAQEEALGIRGLCRFSQALPLRDWHHGVRSRPCPKGTWRIGRPLGVPLPQALQHLLEARSPRRARDSHWNCLSSHKSPRSECQDIKAHGLALVYRCGKTEAETGWDGFACWQLVPQPLPPEKASSNIFRGLRTCKRPHQLSLPCAHFPSPAVLPGRLTPQPEGKGHQPGQARADPTSMRLGAEAS